MNTFTILKNISLCVVLAGCNDSGSSSKSDKSNSDNAVLDKFNKGGSLDPKKTCPNTTYQFGGDLQLPEPCSDGKILYGPANLTQNTLPRGTTVSIFSFTLKSTTPYISKVKFAPADTSKNPIQIGSPLTIQYGRGDLGSTNGDMSSIDITEPGGKVVMCNNTFWTESTKCMVKGTETFSHCRDGEPVVSGSTTYKTILCDVSAQLQIVGDKYDGKSFSVVAKDVLIKIQ